MIRKPLRRTRTSLLEKLAITTYVLCQLPWDSASKTCQCDSNRHITVNAPSCGNPCVGAGMPRILPFEFGGREHRWCAEGKLEEG